MPQRRVETTRFPELREGRCVWVEVPTMGTDDSTHFPAAGAAFAEEVGLTRGRVGFAWRATALTTRCVGSGAP